MAPEGDAEISGIGARFGRNATFNLFEFGSRLSCMSGFAVPSVDVGMLIICTGGPVLEGTFGLTGMLHTGSVGRIRDVSKVFWGDVDRSTTDVVVLQIFIVTWSPNLLLPRLLRSFSSFGSSW